MAAPRLAGLALGLLAGISAVNAAEPVAAAGKPALAPAPAVAPTPSNDPAKQLPGTISVANIDFKRGDGGSGKLIVRFSGEGALPDMRSQGSQVTIDVGNAQLPAALQRPLNVADFATPVQRIDARSAGTGSQLVLNTAGAVDTMAYQTGRDYIVEVVPRTASAGNRAVGAVGAKPAAGAAPTSGTIGGSAPVAARSYSGRPVTFNFQDVPVRTVLQLVAEESNLNIVAADTVQGNVTLRLVNVPWDQALDIVLQAKGLDKRRSGNVVWVAPQAEVAKYEQDREDARIALDNRVDLVTEYVQINYHNAAQIYKALTEAKGIGGSTGGSGGNNNVNENGFLSPRGRLVADERTNTLMISDIPKKVAQMKDLIKVIDRPVDQVLIEARIVIASESFARDLGARFGVSGQKGDVITSGTLDSINNYRNTAAKNDLIRRQAAQLTDDATRFRDAGNATKAEALQDQARSLLQTLTNPAFLFPASLNTNLARLNPAGAIAFTILGKYVDLDMEFSAMQTEGRGEVVSNPRVVTSNQREAVIRQGEEVGYVTISPQQGGNNIPIPNVQFKDVLMEMKVNPTITNDGRVFLNLDVKKDEISRYVNTSIGEVPQINKRNINTAVLVEDGQTVVIGGVYEFRDRSDLSKVPFLADIPFLGNLFKRKTRSKDKAELLIFVTPKVMKVAQR
ncbi:type IV pilus secretin PilQ [Lysobacter enzymogenes]|uniref:Type IV pilus secretin PilQ n=2 Tax=Lysobacter enzymogenes TaxID=69 RepID=A0A3N2RB97_LYSEN|nr:type IV pilus secretin PilQ [Lysobacter enzymogenes]ROU04688.1 type IV pilus secretin PilQ [Lysobacter enzymogenes]